MTKRAPAPNPRTSVNHGHNEWNGTAWVPTFHTWCPSCRAALAKMDRKG